jgi:L-arabinose isomerase
MKALIKAEKPKIGFLFIGCQRFKPLGENTKSGTYVQRIARETAAITGELTNALEIVNPGDVYDISDLNRALDAFSSQRVDCILIVFHSWTEDNIWIRFLRESNKSIPLIYFCPAKESIPFDDCRDENDLFEFLANGGLVGTLVGSGSIAKMGRTAKVLVGTLKQRKDDIIQYATLCRIRSLLHKSRFGIMPAYNEIMWNTYVDPYRVFSFGPEVTFIGYDELAAISEGVSNTEISRWKDELKSKYILDGDISEEKFDASIRYSIGLQKIMESYDLDAMTLNDVDMRLFEKIGLRPGFYPNAINESLSILCPEADMGIAISSYFLKLLTRKQINTVEPFYIDDSRNLFCGGHAGPNDYNYSESLDYVKISFDARFAKTKYRYAGAPFAWLRIPPGKMTMVHMSQINGEIKLVASLVESLDGPHRINGYTHSEFRPLGLGISDFFTKIIAIGTTQHFVVVQGDYINQLRDLAELCKFTFYTI